MEAKIILSDYNKIHFTGIGGCSMSGLALLLHKKGVYVQGSDVHKSVFTEMLEKNGIKVTYGHSARNIEGCDLLVYSAAIPETNPERAAAKERGIPQLERCDCLGELSSNYRQVVGIAGCHGKTTITSMLTMICDYAKLNPSVHVGGYVDYLESGVKAGSNDLFITEACEYVESFLSLHPTIALINNIDNDHLNYYHDIEHIEAAFEKYINLLPEDGVLIACTDDPRVKRLFDAYSGKKLSYGFNKEANFRAENIKYNEKGFPEYEMYRDKTYIAKISLNVIGEYNVKNALAASVVALLLGSDMLSVSNALTDFKSAKRRFEFMGTKNGAKVFHDYAHHPGEIRAVLGGAKRYSIGKLFVVFQCNSYSRAKTLFSENVTCFSDAGIVLVVDIYPGRETDDGSISATDIVKAINKSGGTALYSGTFENASEFLSNHVSMNDIILTLGSGDVYEKTKIIIDSPIEGKKK